MNSHDLHTRDIVIPYVDYDRDYSTGILLVLIICQSLGNKEKRFR